MYYIWLGIYEMYYYVPVYVLGFVGIIFRVLFVWGRLVCVHENREPSGFVRSLGSLFVRF